MKGFYIDLSVCNGCYSCQIACKDENVGNDWTPYAKPQPDTGQFWIGITELIRGQVPKVKITYIPQLCHHCDDAPCIAACQVEGAIYKREDGLVIIDPIKCTGCKLCKDSCPHDAIFFNENLNIAQKCTGCAHLLDNDAEWVVPRCVDVCPTDALRFGEEEDFKDFIAESEFIHPAAGTKSRVYYKHLPKKFVAGTVYDPKEKEVIIGATCTLKDEATGETVMVTTDNFGDFWFRGLKDDRTFTLVIEKAGKSKTIDSVVTDKDLSLGDIPMEL